MKCKAFLSHLPEWLDHRSATAQVALLESHAAACPTCASELEREQRLVAMLDSGLVDPPVPSRLRDRIHRAVDALAIVEARPLGPTPAGRSPEGVPVYAHPIAIQWLSMSAVLAITLTAGMAVGRSTGTVAPVPTAPLAEGTAQNDTAAGSRRANPTLPAVPTAPRAPDSTEITDGNRVVAIGEPVAEQLARHLDTTEKLYHRVMHATPADPADARRTRALMNAELTVSQIRRATPALRIAIKSDPALAEPARCYFDEAENLYARIEEWVDSPEVELNAVRGELDCLRLPRQIEQLRVALGPSGSHSVRALPPDAARLLPAEVMKELAGVPGSEIYVQFLQEYNRGRTLEAFGRLQQLRALIERSPRSPLAEDYEFWVGRMAPGEEATVEVEVVGPGLRREIMVQPVSVAQFDALRAPAALVIDGRRIALRAAAEPAAAFVLVWQTAETRQLELGRAGHVGGLVVTDAETHQTTVGSDAKTPPSTIVLRQVALELPAALWSKELEAAYAALCQRASVPPPIRSARPRILQITVPMTDLPRDR